MNQLSRLAKPPSIFRATSCSVPILTLACILPAAADVAVPAAQTNETPIVIGFALAIATITTLAGVLIGRWLARR